MNATQKSLAKLILPISILSICLLYSGGSPVLGSTDTVSPEVSTRINMPPSSQARFFDCGVTPPSGSSSLTGLDSNTSGQAALTDRDLDTIIMGGAKFDVSLADSMLFNVPGPELVAIEMHSPEPINVSISDPDTNVTRSVILAATPSNATNTNNCDYPMNQVFVDLSSLGVPVGSAVPTIRFDNLGAPDTYIGSDIAEIFTFRTDSGSSPTSESSQGNIPFLRQN